MNKQRLQLAVKEFGRIVVLAIPSVIVAALIQVLSNDPQLSTGVGALVLAALRSYDKGLHDDPTTNAKGIVPF